VEEEEIEIEREREKQLSKTRQTKTKHALPERRQRDLGTAATKTRTSESRHASMLQSGRKKSRASSWASCTKFTERWRRPQCFKTAFAASFFLNFYYCLETALKRARGGKAKQNKKNKKKLKFLERPVIERNIIERNIIFVSMCPMCFRCVL